MAEVGFRHIPLDEVADQLEELRERQFGNLGVYDNSMLEELIHHIREKLPDHDRASCMHCTYFGWDKEDATDAAK